MDVLLKNARIVQPGNSLHGKKRDILILRGKIQRIAANIPEQDGVKVLSHQHLHVSPGWMDMSVSLGEPGYEERETLQHGLDVAARSGFTRVCLQPDTMPVTDNRAAVQYLIDASRNTPVKVHPIGAMTRSMKGEEMAELYDMQSAGAVAFGDYMKGVENPLLMKVCLQYVQAFDGLVMSFPQDKILGHSASANESPQTVRLGLKGNPPLAESVRISRDLHILEYTGAKIFFPTVSVKKSVELIKKAKRKGLNVGASVSVHHLYMNDSELVNFDTRYNVQPPLRTAADNRALIKAVKEGSIDVITSDHRPLDIEVKKKEFDLSMPGTIGMESLFGALNFLMDLDDFIPAITSRPREILGLEVPEIAEGKPAELTLFDPVTEWEFSKDDILSNSYNSAFLGKKMKGRALGIYHKNTLILS